MKFYYFQGSAVVVMTIGREWDSVIGITTPYRLDGPWFEFR